MALLAVVVLASACADSTGPSTAPDVGGRWKGTLTHPSYDGGALTLNMIDANGAVSGNYVLILSKRVGSRVSVEESRGPLNGSSTKGRLRLFLTRPGGDEWLLDGVTSGPRAQGDWTSERRVQGSFSVSR
jgi:hypothetical protein